MVDAGQKLKRYSVDKITKEELLEIASLTKLELADSDIEQIRDQLSAVLEYAASVQAAKEVTILSNKNINHDRVDSIENYDSEKNFTTCSTT